MTLSSASAVWPRLVSSHDQPPSADSGYQVRPRACLSERSVADSCAVHWGGDVDTEWTGLAETLRGGLSLGLSGFAYFSHDIGGFKAEGKAGGDLTKTPAAAI